MPELLLLFITEELLLIEELRLTVLPDDVLPVELLFIVELLTVLVFVVPVLLVLLLL